MSLPTFGSVGYSAENSTPTGQPQKKPVGQMCSAGSMVDCARMSREPISMQDAYAKAEISKRPKVVIVIYQSRASLITVFH